MNFYRVALLVGLLMAAAASQAQDTGKKDRCADRPAPSPFALSSAENGQYVQESMIKLRESRAQELEKAGDKEAAASCRQCGDCAPTKPAGK